MKQWVIPDIHGCAKTLNKLLDRIELTKSDELYFLGDYIDRGPSSKEVLDILIGLKENGCRIFPILGNHEVFLLKVLERQKNESKSFLHLFNKKIEPFLYAGGNATLASFGIERLADIPEKYVRFIAEMPFYYELEKFILVHAGFNFKNDTIFEDTKSMTMIYDFIPDPVKTNYRTVVHGHNAVSLECVLESIKRYSTDYFICLDNGCVYPENGMGNLLALNLGNTDLVIQENIDF